MTCSFHSLSNIGYTNKINFIFSYTKQSFVCPSDTQKTMFSSCPGCELSSLTNYLEVD